MIQLNTINTKAKGGIVMRDKTVVQIQQAKLRYFLFRSSLSQRELAELAGVNRNTICGICNGRSCSAETADKIACALGIPLEKLTKARR